MAILLIQNILKFFGDKLQNPFITVDFAESQIEMITPALPSIKEMYEFLENLQDIISVEIGDEYLWPQSTPANLPCINSVSSANFDESNAGVEAKKYRNMLSEKYGKTRQLLSGIHYNFSFEDEFITKLHKVAKSGKSYRQFKDDLYLKIARNYTRYRWLIVYLLGASSSVHKSFEKCTKNLEELDDSYYLKNGVSFRHTRCGYRNNEELFVSLDSIESYSNNLQKLIDTGTINNIREYYSPIRLKSKDNKNGLNTLKKDGIEYLEIRTIDLNPYSKLGIELKDLYFLHLFLLYCLFKDEAQTGEVLFSEKESETASQNQELVARNGLENGLNLINENGKSVALNSWAMELLNEINSMEKFFVPKSKIYNDAIDFQKSKVLDKSLTYASKQLKDIKKDSFIKFHINRAEEYLQSSKKSEFSLKGYEDLELSTQILLKNSKSSGGYPQK